MSDTVIRVENLWKQYRLGAINHGTLRRDLQSWWARVHGHADPNLPLDFATQLPIGTPADSSDRFWALREISFEVRRGEVLGIIGRNGAGKSTLLKILSRVTTPTRGEIKVKGRVASLLEVGTGFHPELTGRENIFLNGAILGMSKSEIRRKLDEIIEFADVARFIDTPVKRYSSGMYVRLAFAVAAHLEPEILVVDEVLAVGDAEFQKKCLGKMGEVAKEGRTVLFVSHNMMAVKRLCSRGLLLASGRIAAEGAAPEVISEYNVMLDRSNRPGLRQGSGFLYRRSGLAEHEDFGITGIQLIGEGGASLEAFGTWEKVGFRVHYAARKKLNRGSVVLSIATPDGTVLILSSTSPDQTVPMSIDAGSAFADCLFEPWPLAAGEYVVGAGLAIPGTEYLCRDDSLCRISVAKRDVYGSGLAPSSDRYVVAAKHHWRLPEGEKTS